MAYSLFPIFLWYLPQARPKYHHMLMVALLGSPAISYAFYGASYGLYHNHMVSVPFLATYMVLTMVCIVFHMGPLVLSCAFVHISLNLYAISYGRTSSIMCYLSAIFPIVYVLFPMFSIVFPMGSTVVPLAYMRYYISQQYGVYVIYFGLYASECGVWQFLWVLL